MTEPEDRLWVTRADAAMLCGVSLRSFDEVIRPRLKSDAIRGKGRSLRYHGPAVVTALVAYRIEQAKPAPVDAADPLMNGPPSDWLEEYRKVNTHLLQRKLAEVDQDLVKADAIKTALSNGIRAMRDTGDRLVRLFGNEAGAIYNEGVAEFEAAALAVKNGSDQPTPNNRTGNPDPVSRVAHEDAATSDDNGVR